MRKVNVVKLYPNSIRFGDEQSKGEEIVQQKKKNLKSAFYNFLSYLISAQYYLIQLKKTIFSKAYFGGNRDFIIISSGQFTGI